MSWFKPKPKLKEEHRMREEWVQVCKPEPPQGGDATLTVSGNKNIQFPLGRSGVVLSCGSVLRKEK